MTESLPMNSMPEPSNAAPGDNALSDEAESVRQAVPSDELLGLLALGQANGSLSMNEVMEVFKDVDPTPDVIMGIRETLAGAGITFEEDEPEELHFEAHPELDDHGPDADETRSGGMAPVVPLTPKPAEPEPPVVTAEPDAPAPPARMTSRERVDKMRAARLAGSSSSAGAADPVRMYLKEIGRVDLLKGDQEVLLAERIETGLIAEAEMAELIEAETLDTISGSKRSQLDADIADGDLAKSALTQANLRLVVSIAKRYVGRGMALLDLVQEGNLGLMRAVEKFDHRKGFKFSTYATWWIRQSITRSIADQARTIRIPVHMVETMNRVKRTQRAMHSELERDPTVEELAERCDLSPDKTREILRISLDLLSLDSPVGSEEDSNLGDFIRDDRVEAPADVAARRLLGQAVLEVLDELNDREKDVVRLRFGLDGGRPRTLEEVGKEFGVTRERIRQIEAKTLAKLRHPHRSDKLRGYLDGQN